MELDVGRREDLLAPEAVEGGKLDILDPGNADPLVQLQSNGHRFPDNDGIAEGPLPDDFWAELPPEDVAAPLATTSTTVRDEWIVSPFTVAVAAGSVNLPVDFGSSI